MAERQAGLAVKPQTSGQTILRLMILEESNSEAQKFIDQLRENGYAVTAARVKSPLEFQAALKKQEWDIILSPFALSNFSAKQALALLAHAKIDLPFIIVCDEITDQALTEALSYGAKALLKKGQSEHLHLTIQQELRDLAQRRARHHYEKLFRESERRCHGLLDASQHAIACVRNGKTLYSNPAYDQLITKLNPNAKYIADLVYSEERQKFEAMVKNVESGKNSSDKIALKIRGENGAPLPATIEAMIAHINDQQCAQITVDINKGQTSAASLTPASKPDVAATANPSSPKPDSEAGDPVMLKKIRDALSTDHFRLLYQPIVPLHAQPAENYEVLTRMIDEHGKDVPPAQFMPVAESAGIMPEIDRWIIRAALQTLVKQHTLKKETSLLVKLSEDNVCDQNLVHWIGEMLQALHLPGDTVIFEIKEAFVLNRLLEAKQFITGLKQFHCRIALGHFGSDPRSLDCLEQLHPNFVKLASTFVDNLSGDPKSMAMVKTVVQTVHDLGSQTIATFVQDASKMATLWQCNVDFIQGYFLQAPEEDLSYDFSDDE